MTQVFVCPDFKDSDPVGKEKAFVEASKHITPPQTKKPPQKKQRQPYVPRGGAQGRVGKRIW